MIPLPLNLKLKVPGYRRRWLSRYACMISEIQQQSPSLRYGVEEDIPWIETKDNKVKLFGFLTEKKNEDVLRILGHTIPSEIPVTHFRLVKDYLNRYIYPHMRPDLKPEGFMVDQMFGFHGQHKDSILDLPNSSLHSELIEMFTPKLGENIIDCGCFLGFGELRIAPEIGHGRIFAVEADSLCYELLNKNIQHNNVENVVTLQRAVWNKELELDLQSDFAQANSLLSEVHKGKTTERVRTITIDRIVDDYNLEKVDMLSLTLNGAEVEAIDGAVHTLKKFRPRIRLAGWYQRNGRKISEITRSQLEPLGYKVFVGSRGNTMAIPV